MKKMESSKNNSAAIPQLHRVPSNYLQKSNSTKQIISPNLPSITPEQKIYSKEQPNESLQEQSSVMEPNGSPTSPVEAYRKFRRNKTFKKNILKRLKQIGPDPDNFDEINKTNNLDKINPKDISGKFQSFHLRKTN